MIKCGNNQPQCPIQASLDGQRRLEMHCHYRKPFEIALRAAGRTAEILQIVFPRNFKDNLLKSTPRVDTVAILISIKL